MDERHSDGLKRATAIIAYIDIVAMKAYGLSRSGGVDEDLIIGTLDKQRGVLVGGRAHTIIEANGKRIALKDGWPEIEAAIDDEKQKVRGVALCVDEADIRRLTAKVQQPEGRT